MAAAATMRYFRFVFNYAALLRASLSVPRLQSCRIITSPPQPLLHKASISHPPPPPFHPICLLLSPLLLPCAPATYQPAPHTSFVSSRTRHHRWRSISLTSGILTRCHPLPSSIRCSTIAPTAIPIPPLSAFDSSHLHPLIAPLSPSS